ncbi:putative membrane protein (plasmid) [Duffyella gerundensis]|uniref:Putative membrane protein n=1 Tax=Duffyella gerundensis TaxID=1619313 RepID=A0A0U5L634_9GAMM|nr:putative membrane protein [Duffyella gerundensis]
MYAALIRYPVQVYLVISLPAAVWCRVLRDYPVFPMTGSGSGS